MRFGLFALVCLVGAAPAAFAQTQRTLTLQSLERLADVADRLDYHYCAPAEASLIQGALDGINAMPERSDVAPLVMRRPGLAGFSDAYSELLDLAEDDLAVEHAAIEGMLRSVDPSGSFFPELENLAQREQPARSDAVSSRVDDGVGVITISAVREDTAEAVRAAIAAVRGQASRGYVVDLRGNTGGLLDQVVATGDAFIDGGRFTTLRAFAACRDEGEQHYDLTAGDETGGARLVVLIDANTASGGEMLAAALRERRGATLIGQSSHGNARVHTLVLLEGGRDGALKMTTDVMTVPSGATWDGVGLAPDIVTDPRTADADPAMTRAMALLRE